MLEWIGAILGGLGVVGFGAACFLVPGFAARALEIATGIVKAVLEIAAKYPWQFALVASLCLSGWLWRGWSAEETDHALTRQAHKTKLDKIEAASQANLAAALAQVKAVEAKSAELAKDADHAHDLALQDARTATDRFIAANRVRPRAAGSCPAPASPEENNPGVPADLPANSGMVAIREDEVQAFAAWVAYGVAAHNGAIAELEAGTAKVPPELPKPAF